MDTTPMKTTMTAIALVLALGTTAYAQEVKPSTPLSQPAASTAAPIAKPAEVTAKPVLAPEMMQKVGAPVAPAVSPSAVTPVTVPAAVAAPKVEAKPAVTPSTTATPVAAPIKTTAPAAATTKLLNVNTVSAADLEKLPKIGEARAKQIIAGRPYKSVDDLIAKKVLPQDAFDAVKGLITIQ